MKELVFLDVTDGSSAEKLQITIEKSKFRKGMNFGASIKASGLLQINKNNQKELLADDISLIGECNLTDSYPFTQRMPYNPNNERESIHLRPRSLSFSSLLRIRHKCQSVLNYVLDEEGFFSVSVPILTSNDCEGGGEVFSIRPDNKKLIAQMIKESKSGSINKTDEEELADYIFFNGKTFLTVSGQLHLEAAARYSFYFLVLLDVNL